MIIKSSPFSQLRTWVKTHKKEASAIAAGFLVVIAGVTTYALLQKPEESPKKSTVKKPEQKPAPKPITYYSPLTGEVIDSEAGQTAPTTAIMIENSPDARPQSGLKDAGIVYEAIAEGGITRFLAIYQNKKPGLIGPVRSLRMYYVDWLAPYNASIAHVGGSQNALNEVRNGSYRDIDQFFNAGTYWRASDRYAPHNVYTSFENIDALNAAKGYTSSTFTGFPRQDGTPATEVTAGTINVNFSGPLYNTAYTYDRENNRYNRQLGGVAHTDREAGQISPSVVVALRVTMQRVLEDGYREQVGTIGSGTAVLFQNGTAQEITWQKADRASPLKLLAADGSEIPLNRGQTWIAAVPTTGGGISWQP